MDAGEVVKGKEQAVTTVLFLDIYDNTPVQFNVTGLKGCIFLKQREIWK